MEVIFGSVYVCLGKDSSRMVRLVKDRSRNCEQVEPMASMRLGKGRDFLETLEVSDMKERRRKEGLEDN
jgi:hypothetical protein